MAIRLSTNRLDLDSANLQSAEMRAWSETVNPLGNVSGATTINLALGNVVTATVTGAVTWTVTNASSANASSFNLILTNGGSAAQTWMGGTSWAGGVAPTLSSAGTDVLTFFTTDAGTTWRGIRAGQGAEAVGQKLFVWGRNSGARLGLGDTQNRSSPVQMGGQWVSVSAGGYGGAAIRPNGSMYRWGSGNYIGDGNTTTARSSPVQLAGTWTFTPTPYHGFSALRADGSAWVWGTSNANGELGLGDTIKRSSPVQLAGTWRFVRIGRQASFGIRVDGSLWAWGTNGAGNLGLGDTIVRSSPVQVPGTWLNINFNTGTGVGAIKSDGSAWMWAQNASGYLGLGDVFTRSSPTQLAGTWRMLQVGSSQSFGIRHDGTLWGWGHNGQGDTRYRGQLGLGDSMDRSSPVQIGTGIWQSVSSVQVGQAALDNQGRLFSWGPNRYGMLGLGSNIIGHSSPAQIAGTWVSVSSGFFHHFGFKR